MKYGELVTIRDGIFAHIDYDFLGQDSETLDVAFYGLYSQRTCSPLVEAVLLHTSDSNAVLDELGKVILALCKDKWAGIEKALAVDYDPTVVFSDKYSEDTSRDTTFDGESSRLDHGKVYGFDSAEDAPVGDRDTSETNSNKHQNTDVFHREYTNAGNHGRLYSTQQLIKQEIDVRSYPFIRQVLSDVANILTNQIYD